MTVLRSRTTIHASVARLLTAIMALSCVRGAVGETIYVDAQALRNGEGSEVDPLNSLAALQEALLNSSHANITVYLAGTFRGERLVVEFPCTNCNYLQWPDKPQAVVRGDVIIQGSWTEEVPGLRYSTAVDRRDSRAGIESVVEDWDIRIDEQGRHFGHMLPVTSAELVERIEGSWYFDGALLHIHATNDENPNASGRTYARCISKSAWILQNHVSCIVDGIDFQLWVDPNNGQGYGIFMGAAHNCTIRNCRVTDFGIHALGFVGTSCVGNTFDQCITRGGRDNGSTGYVFFTEYGSMYNCRAQDCEAHLHHVLDVFGQPLLAGMGWSSDGFYAHTGAAALITDVEMHRCITYGYEIPGGFAFSAGNYIATPLDLNDPESYAVRFYDCSLINGASNSFHFGAYLALVRCDLDLTRMTDLLPISATAFNSQFSSRILFESCTIAVNTDGMMGPSCFRMGSNVHYRLRGCTVYDDGMDTENWRSFFRFTSPSSVADASQTLFVHRSLQNLSTANAGVVVPAANQRFDHCWFVNIRRDEGYSPNSLFDSLAEFTSLIDRNAIVDVDPLFVAAPDDLEGVPGGPLRSTVVRLPRVDRVGINGHDYSGNFGAHQYGHSAICPADLDGNNQVNGIDLALLLSSWGRVQAGTAGDLNEDLVISGLDLAVLLAAWGACPTVLP